MTLERFLNRVEAASTWIGKGFAWLIVALMLLVCVEVVKRYKIGRASCRERV